MYSTKSSRSTSSLSVPLFISFLLNAYLICTTAYSTTDCPPLNPNPVKSNKSSNISNSLSFVNDFLIECSRGMQDPVQHEHDEQLLHVISPWNHRHLQMSNALQTNHRSSSPQKCIELHGRWR